MAAPIDRAQLLAALRLTNPSVSSYLDLESGSVFQLDDTADDPQTEAQRTQIMEGYGDRYRYVAGGNADADDSAIDVWLEGEGLA